MAAVSPISGAVAVMGCGVMGTGIAQVAAVAAHEVRLWDVQPFAIQDGLRRIRENLTKLVANGRLTIEAAEAAIARVHSIGGWAELGEVELVIEAITEDLESKRDLFRDLEPLVPVGCILATNTSSLSITAIARHLQKPGRVVGMHFFNPAPLMELVEVVSGLVTDPAVADRICATARAWGKTPVSVRSTPGFIVNRIARSFYVEALRILQEQAADAATIDAIFREAGSFRMGPFELIDLIGQDVNFAVTKSLFEESFFDPRYAPSVIQKELVTAGFLGRKSGRGFYRYAAGVEPPKPQNLAPASLPRRIRICGPGKEAQATSIMGKEAQATSIMGKDAHATPIMGKDAHATPIMGKDAHATHGFLQPFLARIRVATRDIVIVSNDPSPNAALVQTDRASLFLTDGRSATRRAREIDCPNTVLIDLAFDYAQAGRLAVARADQCSIDAFEEVVGVLQRAGYQVSSLNDLPGMAVMRTVVMIINEAYDAVHQGVCTGADADLAMVLGLNYPAGPFAWSEILGIGVVREVLVNLASHYGPDRYRLSPLMDRRSALQAHSP
jgi:3-hydroxybutyryl-CoA dehydrogenase